MEGTKTITLNMDEAKQPNVELLNRYDRIMVPRDILTYKDDNADTIRMIYETLSLTDHEVIYYK